MIYLFDRYLALQDVLNSPLSAKMNRRLVGVDELLVEEKLDKLKVKMIQDADYAGVFFKEKFYIFKIIKKEMHNHITFRGINYAYDELANLKVIEDRRLYDVAGSVAIQVALEGTTWELGTVQSTSTKSTNFYYVTPLEAIQKVIETWGVEPDFYFTFDGRKITGRKVDVYQKRGKLVGERYVYGSDLLEIVHEENRAEIVTALYGRGKGEETLDKDGNPTGGYGRRINFSDVVWSKAKGDPVNKPKGVEYLEITEATSLYGYPLKDGALSPRYAVYINDQIEDPVELIHETYKVLVNKARPILTLRTTVAKVGPYELGDTNYIIRPDLGIMYEARIFEDEINLLDESKTTFKFGDYVLSGTAQRMKDLKARFEGLNNKIEGLDKQVKNQLIKISKDWFDTLIEEKGENFFSGQSFNYSLENGNEFGLPAGIYSFDKAIDANPGPTGFLVIQGGKLGRGRITPSGEWEFNLIGDADGLTASAITAGKIKAQFVEIGPSSTFLEGYDPTKKANANDVYTKIQMDTRFTILDGEISSKITTEVTDVINEIGLPEDGYTPVKGIDYFDGTPGKDGRDGISEHLHIRYSQTSDGASPTTDPTNAKYIGIAATQSATPPASNTYKWTLIKGKDGTKGTPGEVGKDGKTSYLHIKYSNDGIKFTANAGETVGDWIGTYVDFIEEDSTNFSAYTWNKVVGGEGYTPIKGIDYFDGIPGRDGKDGINKFLHIRYAQDALGNGFTTDPTDAKYMGVAVTPTNAAPPAGQYQWTLIKGTDGKTGEVGKDGKTSYLHIKYSNDGKTFTGNNGEDVGKWIGTYVDFIEADSNVFSKYTWNYVVGEDGYTPVKGLDYFDGLPGQPGRDGKSEYLHVRYSQASTGLNPTTDPTDAKYIGVAVSNSETPPAAGAYKWTMIKGKDGEKGTPGEPGPNGKTSYLHIKYSNDGVKFTGNNGEDVGDWIGTYVDFIEEDSEVFNKYTWNKVVGKAGYTPVKGLDYFDGLPGTDGNDGKSKFLHIRYSQTSDGANPTTSPNNAKYMGVAVTDSDVAPAASAYKWVLIKGQDGLPGEQGPNGKTSYLHIKYSNDGEKFTGNAGENVGKYIGTYVDFIEEDSTDFNRYTWNRVVGKDGYTPVKGIDYFDGIPGIAGPPGQPGKSKYLHVRYSQTETGASPTTNPVNAKYMGIAITESNDPPAPALYNWTLIKGQDGTPGAPGPSGKTSFLHIKYSNNGTTFTANNGETVGEWIGTYVDFVEADSNTFSDYTWNKIAGRSIESVVVEYAQTTSPTSVDGATWSTTSPTWIKGQYIWSRTKTTYSTGSPSISQPAMITGSEGKDGNAGAPGAPGTPGQGITSIKPQYYLSTLKTSQAGGSWQYTPQTIDTLKFMWTRNEIVWKNPTATTYTTAILSQEIEEIKEVIKRVVTVENRTTKNAIIGTIRDETTSDGKPLFAKTSEVKQEVDNWTATFSSMSVGPHNLALRSDKFYSNVDYPTTSYDLSEKIIEGEDYIVSFDGHLGVDKTKFALYLNGGAILLTFVESIGGGKYEASFKGTADLTTIEDVVYVYPFPSSVTGVVNRVFNFKLAKGNKSTPYSRSPLEIYSGMTRIDSDGINVSLSNNDINTQIAHNGLSVYSENNLLATFGGSGAQVPVLTTDSITGDIVNVLAEDVTLTVGEDREFATITKALQYLGGDGKRTKFLNGKIITINVFGVIEDDVFIRGYQSGEINITFYTKARLNGRIYLEGNTTSITIQGSSTTSRGVISYSGITPTLIDVWACNYVRVQFMEFDRNGNTNVNAVRFNNGSIGLVNDSDFGTCRYGINLYRGSLVNASGNRGSNTSTSFFIEDSTLYQRGTKPTTGINATRGHYVTSGTITDLATAFVAPSKKSTSLIEKFYKTSMYTNLRGTNTRANSYGYRAVQGRVSSMSTAMDGYVVFNREAYDFIQGASGVTVKLWLYRTGDAHGYSSPVTPSPDNFSASFGGASRGQWVSATISSSYLTSSGATFKFYSPNVNSGYAIFSNAYLEVKRTKTI